MQGPNIEALKQLAEKVSISITASGGISSLPNIDSLKRMGNNNIDSCIIGKALYINQIDLVQAIQLGEKI